MIRNITSIYLNNLIRTRFSSTYKMISNGNIELTRMGTLENNVIYRLPVCIGTENDNQLLHSPEDIADAFAVEPKNFINFIHANYIGHYASIEDVIGAAESISISDIIVGEYRNDQMGIVGLNIAARGVMVCNTTPVSGWMPVRGPKRLEIDKGIKSERRSFGVKESISNSLFATEYRSFVKIIYQKI